MQIVYKKLTEIAPYPNNPRDNTDAIPKVAESIRQYGFKVPIVIDKNGFIVNGHTRMEAAKSLGMIEVPCIIADDLTPDQIRSFRIADNRTGEVSTWNLNKLNKELSKLTDNFFTGFDLGEGFEIGDFSNVTMDYSTVKTGTKIKLPLITFTVKVRDSDRAKRVKAAIENLIEKPDKMKITQQGAVE